MGNRCQIVPSSVVQYMNAFTPVDNMRIAQDLSSLTCVVRTSCGTCSTCACPVVRFRASMTMAPQLCLVRIIARPYRRAALPVRRRRKLAFPALRP